MKKVIGILLFCCCMASIMAQSKTAKTDKEDPNKKKLFVETACGECKLGLPGKTCDLAIRIDGKSYFVDGTKIGNYGDAHAKDGFCEAVRQAAVQGKIVGNRFKATYFKLLPDDDKKQVN